jgi:hypothetical protein
MRKPGLHMSGEEYEASLKATGLTQTRLARLVDAGGRSATRWAVTGPPAPVAIILRLIRSGRLSAAEVEAAKQPMELADG